MTALGSIFQASLARYGAALEYPEFRTMWFANLWAQAAAWALIVTRGWLVFDMTHSSVAVGVVTFAVMAPMLFMPPISGVLADRMDRRTLLASTYAVNFFHNLVLGLLAASGVLVEWHIVALSVVNGMARATQLSVSQALAANLVPSHRLLNALSLNQATQHASRLVGPALVAPLLGFMGAAPAFFLCTALYGVGWAQILQVKTRTQGGVKRRDGFVASFLLGLRYVRTQPFIAMVLVLVFFHCGLTMAFEALLPPFVGQRLSSAEPLVAGHGLDQHNGLVDMAFRTDATGFATLMMGVGLGALVGSILIGGVQDELLRGRLYLALGLLSGFGQVLLSFASNMPVALGAAGIMGGSQAAFMTMGQALMQALAADEYRGRIASLNTLSFGGIMAVMNLVNGALGAPFGVSSILFVNGLLFIGIMGGSFAFATPRGVYVRGMPAVTRA